MRSTAARRWSSLRRAAASDAIVELAGDRDLRLKFARQGREHVAGFTWPRSVSAIERVFAGAEPGGEDPLA